MKNYQPVRKLNKRLIYWSLMGLLGLSVPAIFALASSNKQAQTPSHLRDNPQPNNFTQDGNAIAGMERFPKTYSDVKQFEQELASNKNSNDDLAAALAKLEKGASQGQALQNEAPIENTQRPSGGNRYASYRESHKLRDDYEARHSDIMFMNNGPKNEPGDGEERMEKVMDRALTIAEKSLDQMPTNPQDMLLMKEKDSRGMFLGNKRGNVGQIKEPSAFMISEGTLIHAILLSEINTDLPGPILARVSNNIWDSKTGQTLLIPQNSKLVGEYNSSVGQGQRRAQIVWTRIIYPNQQSIDLERMVGVDKKGTSGVAGSVDNHYDKVALALIMSTTLGAGVRMTQGKYDPNSSSMSEDFGNSLAQEVTRFGTRVADKMMAVKPTITIALGERLNVFVEQDLHLKPYSG